MAKNKKITKYRPSSVFNIGTLLFGTVFIYLVICIFIYFTETHITSYEVVNGTLGANYRFSALSIRTEETVEASQSGYVQYYAREGTKVSAGSTVCSLQETDQATEVSYSNFSLEDSDSERLRNTISRFVLNYSGDRFQKTYSLKASVEGQLSEITSDLSTDNYILNRCTATNSGFVIYGLDGYENVTAENLTSDLFDENAYELTSLRSEHEKVKTGDTLFKLITKETWYLYFPMDNELVTRLQDTSSITVRFLMDNEEFTAPFEIIQNGTEYFGQITMDHSLVRYCEERFLEIELLLTQKSGLKVPQSAIVKRQFLAIPEEYAIVNEDTSSEISLKIERFSADGSGTEKVVTTTVYSHSNGVYLIDYDVLEMGDYVLKAGSNKSYTITDDSVQTLTGVYNINKGYAIFREVEIIAYNDEYCIVKSNSQYGLAVYDYIVKDASQAKVDQIMS